MSHASDEPPSARPAASGEAEPSGPAEQAPIEAEVREGVDPAERSEPPTLPRRRRRRRRRRPHEASGAPQAGEAPTDPLDSDDTPRRQRRNRDIVREGGLEEKAVGEE